jgi:hypothetical protein
LQTGRLLKRENRGQKEYFRTRQRVCRSVDRGEATGTEQTAQRRRRRWRDPSRLSFTTVAAGFTLLTADLSSAAWLGHPQGSFLTQPRLWRLQWPRTLTRHARIV